MCADITAVDSKQVYENILNEVVWKELTSYHCTIFIMMNRNLSFYLVLKWIVTCKSIWLLWGTRVPISTRATINFSFWQWTLKTKEVKLTFDWFPHCIKRKVNFCLCGQHQCFFESQGWIFSNQTNITCNQQIMLSNIVEFWN